MQEIKDHISICICTYHRNQMLERLLQNIGITNYL